MNKYFQRPEFFYESQRNSVISVACLANKIPCDSTSWSFELTTNVNSHRAVCEYSIEN